MNALLTVSFTLFAIACSPEATAPAGVDPSRAMLDKKVRELEERYGWVGKYHTEGLEHVFAELSRFRGKPEKKSFCTIAAKAMKEFHRNARREEIPFHLVDQAIAGETCGEEFGESGIVKNVIVSTPRVAADELSPLAMSYLDEIGTAIFSAESKQGLLSTLLNIQYAAVANLSFEEAGAVVATVSIAISSMEYWEMNLESWINLPGTIAVPYARTGEVSLAPVAAYQVNWPRWWSHPFVANYRKVVASDALGGARVLYTTWRLGPIGWDAAAASALFASVTTALSLLF
jgi:hypothetical protein